jgi:hypothetical protein
MRKLLITAALVMLAAPAFAFQCPKDLAEIDAALAAGTTLSEGDLNKVMSLRATGETQHNAGDHASAVSTLEEAKIILGIN